MDSLFLNTLVDWGWLAYLAIFFLLWIEGDMVVFASVFLAQEGYLSLTKLVPILFLGTLSGDFLWFWLGKTLNIRHEAVGRWSAKITTPIRSLLSARPHWAIFISKFTYGMNKATLIWAGSHQIDFRKFLFAELFTLVCWLSVLANLAYFSAASSVYLKSYLKYAEVGLLIGILLLFGITRMLAWIGHRLFVNGDGSKSK